MCQIVVVSPFYLFISFLTRLGYLVQFLIMDDDSRDLGFEELRIARGITEEPIVKVVVSLSSLILGLLQVKDS
jgi:hypothetical protein